MRGGRILLLAVFTGAVVGVSLAAAAGRIDKGSDRPPKALSDARKTIWMTEWTACWRLKMGRLSSVLHVRVGKGTTPQQAARKLAHRAVFLLYETASELSVAADGCRNGILWRYYHPRS